MSIQLMMIYSFRIPKRLSEITTPTADRCGLSIRQQLMMQSCIVTQSGGQLKDTSMSVSTVHRQRLSAREKLVKKIKDDWELKKPQYGIIHWDSKLFHLISGREEDRVAVLMSGSINGYYFICSSISQV